MSAKTAILFHFFFENIGSGVSSAVGPRLFQLSAFLHQPSTLPDVLDQTEY
jgi:hypothetical protein